MHLQRNATQRNATQRNANHHYILNNNFKFYIYQFFRTLEFLSVFVRFAKIISFVKESKSSYFFEWQKSKHATGGQSPKTISFFVKKSGQKNNYNRITKSIRKNFFALCGKFINLFDASNFEIISQSDYGFCYKNYFFNLNQVFRNSYDFGESFGKNNFGNCNFGFDFWNEIYGIGNNLAGFLFI